MPVGNSSVKPLVGGLNSTIISNSDCFSLYLIIGMISIPSNWFGFDVVLKID